MTQKTTPNPVIEAILGVFLYIVLLFPLWCLSFRKMKLYLGSAKQSLIHLIKDIVILGLYLVTFSFLFSITPNNLSFLRGLYAAVALFGFIFLPWILFTYWKEVEISFFKKGEKLHKKEKNTN